MMNMDQARAGEGSKEKTKIIMAEPEDVQIPEGWKKSGSDDEDPAHQEG